jgi:MarR family transcriptional regulator, organic hydroperoxide resistance regulator
VPGSPVAEAERFTEMMRRAKRNKNASRTAVAILRADSKVSQVLERALAEGGLTLPQFNVLMELASSSDGELPLYELNSRLISTPPNTSWLSRRMQDAGLVTKSRDTQDCRVVQLTLTEKGWHVLEQAAPLVFEAEKQLLGGYSNQELCALADLLDPVVCPTSMNSPAEEHGDLPRRQAPQSPATQARRKDRASP